MKNILILILALCATMASEAATTKTRPSETAKLSEKVDSLTSVIDDLSHNIQAITKTQEMLSVRMAETREDYMTFLTDSHETRNWTIGIISLIVGAFGIATPIFLNHQAKKKSEKALKAVSDLSQNIDNINTGIISTQNRIDDVAKQINKDRKIINSQLSDITNIKKQVTTLQKKSEASENNARKSQLSAMISRLFSEALKEKDSNRAIELYSRILKLDPQDIDALNNRSIAYSDTKQYHLAIQDAEQYIKLKPDSPNGYAIIGLIYLEQKDYARAIKYCEEAIHKDPQDIRGYRTLSSVYLESEQWQNLIDTFNIIAQKDQLTAMNYNNRAYAYYKLGKLEIALADANEALSMDNDDNSAKAHALDTRACIYIAMGPDYYNLALNDLNKAIALDPNLWALYENRAALYQKMMEVTSDPAQEGQYKQLRLADLETFRKQSTYKGNESDDTK